jgi:hypothetical protein
VITHEIGLQPPGYAVITLSFKRPPPPPTNKPSWNFLFLRKQTGGSVELLLPTICWGFNHYFHLSNTQIKTFRASEVFLCPPISIVKTNVTVRVIHAAKGSDKF